MMVSTDRFDGAASGVLTCAAVVMSRSGARRGLRGRRHECEALDRLLASARAGRSRVLVLRGEPGVGKTALVEYLLESATGCRTARAAGVESEMELPFAGLHQLCAPMLERLDRLPGPQRDALAIAFGLSTGDPPDRFLVGLAVLTLLADAAEEQPLVCVVDEAQWLDRVSAQVLAFVARRLQAERLALVFAVRGLDGDDQLAGLQELVVRGLRDGDARALLEAVVPGRIDERIKDRIRRNPRQPARVAGAAARVDRGRAGRRVRTPRCPAAGQPDRTEPRAAHPVASRSDATAAARGGGGAGG